MKRDPSLDALLDLDGQVFVVDPEGHHWVRFVVNRVPTTSAKPRGLDYSLSPHGPDGERLVGLDNAHPVRTQAGPAGRRRKAQDHRHHLKTVRAYEYKDAATCLRTSGPRSKPSYANEE